MRTTPYRDWHASQDARFVDFFGWEMPVQYEGILDETRAVRDRGGLFDLCHMGRIEIRGPDREALVEHVFSGNFAKLRTGRAKYGFLLNDEGYPIDDVLVYRDEDVVHIVINATGRDKDTAWIVAARDAGSWDASVEEVSDAQSMIALQGRISEEVLQTICDADLSKVRYYRFANAQVLGTPTLLARTGYTGEDGFELFFDPAQSLPIWEALMDAGAPKGLRAIGLGARDLLRLEAGMPLYGQEINTSIDPLEADLAFGVDLSQPSSRGITALAARHAKGASREAISLAAAKGRVPRPGCPVVDGDTEIGVVTSGGVSPTIERNIARALVQTGHGEPGKELGVMIRGKRWPMTVVPAPFYKRAR